MKIFGLVHESIVDGPGYRFAVFVQGCPHKCPGCHNPGSHAFDDGMEMTPESIIEQFTKNPLLRGITLTGGEPMCQAKDCLTLAKAAHEHGLDVWCYTGYTLKWLLQEANSDRLALLKEIDVLVDGPYIEALRSLSLEFRGSSNQTIHVLQERR